MHYPELHSFTENVRIILDRQEDIDYWCQAFQVRPEQLRQAVQQVGTSAVTVSAYIRLHPAPDSAR